jgi:DNA-binding NarL/FixJ family response regulator
MTIRVVVVDDHEAVRTGLVMILGSAPDIDVVAECGDGPAAVRAVAEYRPDVVLMDVRMPGIDGVEATRRILAAGSAQVLVLTTFDLDEFVDGSLAAGAAGFLLKSVDATRLVEGVRAVARGQGVLAPEVTRRVIARYASPSRRSSDVPGLERLTTRERDVLAGLGRGLSNAGLSAELTISEATAKTHVSRVLTKLGLRSRTQAAIAAQDAGRL